MSVKVSLEQPLGRRTWSWPHFAVGLLVLGLVVAKWDRQTGFTSLLRFGESWHPRRLEKLQALPIAKVAGSNGYDGQFYAQLAVDPLLRAPELERAIDAPAYRARRILMPWLAALLGFNRPWWTLHVFALLNVFAWVGVAWLLQREIADASVHGFARWSGCMLALGTLESVRQSLVDLPALALVLWAVSALRAGRERCSALVWPLAVLTKETAFLAALAAQAGPRRDIGAWRRPIVELAIAALPLILWMSFVAARLGRWSETGAEGNLAWPGMALASQVASWVSQLAQGDWSERAGFGLLGVTGLLIQAVVVVRRRQPESVWWRIGMAYAVLLPWLGVWVWSGYWAAARALLPLTVAFNLLLSVDRGFWLLWVIGNLSLVHGIIRFV